MTLKDSIASDATAIFLDTTEFAETVTYYPDQYFGEAARDDRTIAAQVIRRAVQAVTQGGDQIVIHIWEVTVANSSTDGIARSELSEGRDRIGITPIGGGTEEIKKITTIIREEDVGMFSFECQ